MSVTGHETTAAEGAIRLSPARARDFFALMKPRVMSLVVFTAFAGLFLAPGGIEPLQGALAILCIALGAGASGALNMWYDADIDAVMSRTRTRPVPSGRVLPVEALAFGLALSAFSVTVLGLAVNWLAAGLLAFTIFFYAVIYTIWLKRRTPQNIVIGGAAGAFPPMIGWAAATGSISLESALLFLIIFLWTPPHFWALALFKSRDYGTAGVPMLPVVRGARATKRQMMVYTLMTAVVAVVPALTGMAGIAYGLFALALSAVFVHAALGVLRMPDSDANMAPARKMFAFSIFYLFAIFSALMADKLAGQLLAVL